MPKRIWRSAPVPTPDRADVTSARQAARDRLIAVTDHIAEAGFIADTTIDLVGVIGAQVLVRLLPVRRVRTNPRGGERAILNYVASVARSRHRDTSRPATVTIAIEPIWTARTPP